MNTTITDNEAKVIGYLIACMARWEGEDVIGVLMKHGCFRDLPGDQLVELSRKLQEWYPDTERWNKKT